MTRPTVELQLTTERDDRPVRNLYPLYLHEIAAYERKPPNRHGVLSDGDERTWEELCDTQAAWWRHPGVLFPYLIRVDGAPAGFSWIASGPWAEALGVELVLYEFFVTHEWRGTGVAAEAFRQGLARHSGRWELCTWPTAQRAIAFWRKTLRACLGDAVRESEEDHAWGRRVVFRFTNR